MNANTSFCRPQVFIAFTSAPPCTDNMQPAYPLYKAAIRKPNADTLFKKIALLVLIGLFCILSSLLGVSTGLLLDEYNLSLQAILAISTLVAILFFLFGFYLCQLVINFVFEEHTLMEEHMKSIP